MKNGNLNIDSLIQDYCAKSRTPISVSEKVTIHMTRKAQLPAAAPSQRAAIIAQSLNMGRSYHANGQLRLAEACYRKVMELDPNNVDALHMLGVVGMQLDATDDAIRLMKRAARKSPRDHSIFVNLGSAYSKAKKYAEAREAFETAIKLKPASLEAHHNLGKLCADIEDFSGAIKAFESALALRPTDPDIYLGLGNAYKYTGVLDKAEACYEQAIKLAPNIAKAYGNLSSVCMDRLKFTDALALVNKAVALEPASGELRFKRSLITLRMEKLDAGWKDYEGRFSADEDPIPRYPSPPAYWAGEDLTDKAIFLWTEQGIGDEILYGSMIADIIPRARRCILECSPRMVPVFARSFPQLDVRSNEPSGVRRTAPSEFDTQISVASLGQYLRPTIDHIPRHQGFMKADAARAATLRSRYQALVPGNLVVGVSWRSQGQRRGLSIAKSSPLSAWSDVLTVPGITFVNLQYGDCDADLRDAKRSLGVDVFHDPDVDSLKSMDDFFAQVAAMDVVVTTSNTTVHVAGSLNVPTLLLLNAGSPGMLWYWFLNRTDSPWYPSVRIFRGRSEAQDGDWWRSGVAEIGQALRQRVQNKPQ